MSHNFTNSYQVSVASANYSRSSRWKTGGGTKKPPPPPGDIGLSGVRTHLALPEMNIFVVAYLEYLECQ